MSTDEYQTKQTATEKKKTMAGLARAQAHKKRRKKATVDVPSKLETENNSLIRDGISPARKHTRKGERRAGDVTIISPHNSPHTRARRIQEKGQKAKTIR